MTIEATPSEVVYLCDGTTVLFAIPFPFDTAADITITRTLSDGSAAPLTNGFSISGGNGSTGNVLFSTAPAGGKITVSDTPAFTQPTDYTDNDPFPAETHEKALDRVTRLAKRLKQLVARSLHFPDGDPAIDGVLPPVSGRKGLVLMFDAATGLPTVGVPTTQTITPGVIGALLYPQSAAEIAAGVVPTNATYRPGNVLRYGADNTGATDCSAAAAKAIAQRAQNGAKVLFPAGVYKLNLVITGQNIQIEGEASWYEDVAATGFIANNTAQPVLQIGDGATLTTSITVDNIKLHGQATAQVGLLVYGASNLRFRQFISRGFTNFAVRLSASTTQPSAYIWFDGYRIDANGNGASVGLDMFQPANYPSSYVTAVYLDCGAISSATGCLWAIQLGANSTLQISNSYISLRHNCGAHFKAVSSLWNCSNVTVDTLGTSADTLMTFDANAYVSGNIAGTITINGKVSMPAGLTPSLQGIGGALGYRTMLEYPSVQGQLDFQDGNASLNNQTTYAQQPVYFSRSGNNLNVYSGSNVNFNADQLGINNAAANADGRIAFNTSGVTIRTGSGSPVGAVAAPVGSLYLRTDGGASTTLYVKESGTGTSGWVAK